MRGQRSRLELLALALLLGAAGASSWGPPEGALAGAQPETAFRPDHSFEAPWLAPKSLPGTGIGLEEAGSGTGHVRPTRGEPLDGAPGAGRVPVPGARLLGLSAHPANAPPLS